MGKIKAFLKRKDIVLSGQRYGIDALGAMAQGLFCTLLVGTILNTIGQQFHIGFLNAIIVTINDVGYTIGGLASFMVGPGIAVAIGAALHSPPLVLYSLIPVGFAANAMGGSGGPLAVFFVAIIAAEMGKVVSKETKVDILVTPLVSILVGVGLSALIAKPIGTAANSVGYAIMWATEQQPFLMGILVSVMVGIALTLPISSAAICASFGLVGLAGGAAVAGCCAQMIGFAVMSFRENKWGGLVAQGIGTSMLQMPNIVKNPRIWIPPHAGFCHHRPPGNLCLSAPNERRAGFLRYGYLWSGGSDWCLHRLGQGHRSRNESRHHGHGLDRFDSDLLHSACGSDLGLWTGFEKDRLDQGK